MAKLQAWYTKEEIKQHVDFLENVLIPDLQDSGYTQTALDFQISVLIINQLLAGGAK